MGSINLITSDRLNQTCAAIRAMKWPGFDHPVTAAKSPIIPVSRRKSIPIESSSPFGSINIKKPIATTIDGVTNGTDKSARIVRIFFHLCLPKYQATGRPNSRVNRVETLASIKVNSSALIVSSSAKKLDNASRIVKSVTDDNLWIA